MTTGLPNRIEETTFTLRLNSGILIASFVINVSAVIYLVRHFTHHHLILRLTSIVAILLSSLIAIYFGIVLNNSLIQSIDAAYNVINKYCNHTMISQVLLVNLLKYLSWIWYLSRIKYFFITTPLKMSNITYYLHTIIYTLIAVISCVITITHSKSEIFIASDNDKYKLCSSNFNLSWVLAILEWFIQIGNISLLYAKTKQYQMINVKLSQHFSERENDGDMLNKIKLMKRCILFGIMHCFMNWISMLLWNMYGIKCLYGLVIVSLTLTILNSFDIHLLTNDATSISQEEIFIVVTAVFSF